MAYETIKYDVAEQILTITLNRPEKLNAFNAAMQKELIDAVADARAGTRDLGNRLQSEGAREMRKASLLVRARMKEQWAEA